LSLFLFSIQHPTPSSTFFDIKKCVPLFYKYILVYKLILIICSKLCSMNSLSTLN
jgi:hypothetical protein